MKFAHEALAIRDIFVKIVINRLLQGDYRRSYTPVGECRSKQLPLETLTWMMQNWGKIEYPALSICFFIVLIVKAIPFYREATYVAKVLDERAELI